MMLATNFGRFMALLPIFIGVSGSFSVLFGAWLSHAGQGLLPADIERLNHAHFYQFLHTIVLLVLYVAYQYRSQLIIALSALLITIGVICFSGSLYVKTFSSYSEITVIAPWGGMSLALGWLVLIFLGKRK
ncbi:DUF423 domain-containing protein [Thalassotalea sp. LPB0316]|uniref:DUF423 domain-containing protein n=1 Tax=Thalassotalea sp. LPB0316 TaxID=2769490 RepID=UPI0018665831|nr:DUF423 domain-containing protein [Thalassotalea sp. LPB0316]QOL24529.1 DUF423 domain-containing protein [Thalassotalea sp. LPB0316]